MSLESPESTTLLSPPFNWALQIRVTSASPVCTLMFEILLAFKEETSTILFVTPPALNFESSIGV